MKKHNYDTKLAAAAISCGGTLGIMIPPSTVFIVYGLLTENSIGQLFLAGILPGIVNVIIYCIVISIICAKNPLLGPAGPKYGAKERVKSAKGTWPVVLLMVIVLGGIYFGVCTTTEAGSLGAAGAIIIALAMKKLNTENLKKSVFDTIGTTGMFIFIIVGSFIFMRFLTLSGLPAKVSRATAALDVDRIWIMLALVVLYLILGAVFDVMSAVVLTIPVTVPLITALGYDPIWFGILVTKLVMIGQVTPPIGMNSFVTAGALGIPSGTVFKGIVPFFISDVVQLGLLLAFPAYPLLLVR